MPEPYGNEEKGLYIFRKPRVSDGPDIHSLIERSRPLDLNSLYSYLLLADHFRDTCIVAERDGKIAGFISAYVHPSKNNTLFVWQVAVGEQERGNGVAGRMLDNLFDRPGLASVSFLETTVNPSNDGSRRLFESFAKRFQAPLVTSVLYPEELFGQGGHEAEILFRIGPFDA
ncbi:MAG TPA: diaminobutyrate acetyltransferase [Deltaproteobacteria bacterium]|nr:diaminobutyrate acetyltransferase [Deltaproteobacteria bacterium]